MKYLFYTLLLASASVCHAETWQEIDSMMEVMEQKADSGDTAGVIEMCHTLGAIEEKNATKDVAWFEVGMRSAHLIFRSMYHNPDYK